MASKPPKELISFEIDLFGSLKNMGKKLDPKLRNKAASRALNDSSRSGRTAASTTIRESYRLPASYVNSKFSIMKSTPSQLVLKLIARARSIHLTRFKGTRQTKKGVSIFIKTDAGRSLLKGRFVRAVRFGADGSGVTTGVFTRVKDKLVAQKTPGVAMMFRQKNVHAATEKRITQIFRQRFWHHLKRLEARLLK